MPSFTIQSNETLRNVSLDWIVKLGIDGRKGFLRFCLRIVERNPFRDGLEKFSPQKRLWLKELPKETDVKRQINVVLQIIYL